MVTFVDDAPPPAVIPSELSRIPVSTKDLAVSLDLSAYKNELLDSVIDNWRLYCYLAAAQIFLQANGALDRKLTPDDIKPRLLGHWGTTPGLSLVYAHTQALIKRRGLDSLFVCGPGHGAPAILSALFVEGAISYFYPEYPTTRPGLDKFVRAFSWPGGFPSHVNAETPGCIHEGGELGYSLAVAYGSVMDKPDLVTVVVVGDGESETGPTATAWHSHKWLDPKESGAVIPILHVNGFKISERTIPGTMDETELSLLYTGYGYQVRFVDYKHTGVAHMGGYDPADEEVHLNFAASLEWAYDEIRRIQTAARSGQPIDKPRWPLLILRTPKGWTGPGVDHGVQLINNFASHQVPLPGAKTDASQLEHLEKWLRSYKPERFFGQAPNDPSLGEKGSVGQKLFPDYIMAALPEHTQSRLGFNKLAYSAYAPLNLSDWKKFGYDKGKDVSAMKAIGAYLSDVIKQNPKSFRIFSPDELASNKLDPVFDVTTRNFQWDPETAHIGGRVTEMLSEHTLQGWYQGYTLTGRAGILPSYEAFLGIVATMLVQYSKFNKMGHATSWRVPNHSLTYIETSTWTRQEHNGFSHQNPGFISTVLSLPKGLARVYFPADANTAVSVIAHCLRSRDYVNLIVGTKAPSPLFLTVEEADRHCIAGASVWERYSTDKGVDPDVVLVGIGFELTQEIICAAAQLRKDFGDNLRVRVVNIIDILVLAPVGEHPHALSEASFNSLFPPHVPVIINYHGYPSQLASLLFNRPYGVGRSRFFISGYSEEGTTTTPWMMLRLNQCGRFDIAKKALEYVATGFTLHGDYSPDKRERLGKVLVKTHEAIAIYSHKNVEYSKYAEATQTDHPDVGDIPTLYEQ